MTIIEEPKKSKSNYGKWLGNELKPSFQEKLRRTIDAVLEKKPVRYAAFLTLMQEAGYEYKAGNQPAFRTAGLKPMKSRKKTAYNSPQRINLVLDIQAIGKCL